MINPLFAENSFDVCFDSFDPCPISLEVGLMSVAARHQRGTGMIGFTFEGLSCSLLLYSQWYQKFMVPKEKIQLTLVNPSIFLKRHQLGAYCSFSKIFSTNIGWIEICEVWCRHVCPSLHELPQPCPLVPSSTVEFVQNSDVAMSNGEIIENAGHLHVSIV